MIIACRNPKDACVSFYHHTKNRKNCSFDSWFNTFFSLWIVGVVGNYCTLKFQARDRKTQILWLNYEDLVKDDESKKKKIRRPIEFIGINYKCKLF